jgi:hypothetical protein
MVGLGASFLGEEPYKKAFTITPSDSTDIPLTRAIMVTVAGNISVIMGQDTNPVTIPVNANTVYRFSVKRLRATNTTATGIIGLA